MQNDCLTPLSCPRPSLLTAKGYATTIDILHSRISKQAEPYRASSHMQYRCCCSLVGLPLLLAVVVLAVAGPAERHGITPRHPSRQRRTTAPPGPRCDGLDWQRAHATATWRGRAAAVAVPAATCHTAGMSVNRAKAGTCTRACRAESPQVAEDHRVCTHGLPVLSHIVRPGLTCGISLARPPTGSSPLHLHLHRWMMTWRPAAAPASSTPA